MSTVKTPKKRLVTRRSPRSLSRTRTSSTGTGRVRGEMPSASHRPMYAAGRVALSGLVLGPMNHGWYKILDGRLPGRLMRVVLMKTLLDWLSCPAFSCTYWMCAFLALLLPETSTFRRHKRAGGQGHLPLLHGVLVEVLQSRQGANSLPFLDATRFIAA